MQSPLRKIAWFQCLSYQLTLTWGQWIFSRLLNSDWSIQISRALAVCKVETAEKASFHSWLSYADVCSEDWTKLFDHCDCQVTHFFPQANQDDINSRNNSDRNSLGHGWVPLRIHVILRTLGLTWRRKHILFKIRQLLSYMATLDELLFGAKLEAWRHKMFHIFHFLQCETVLGIVNSL